MKYQLILTLIIASLFSFVLTRNSALPIQDEPETQKLQTIMQRLMMDMQTIEVGIWNENFETIESGALQIVNHPKVSMERRKEIASLLGEQMKTFAAFDQVVHGHADSLAKKAEMKDMQAVLKHYSIIQKACVDCHSTFRPVIMEAK